MTVDILILLFVYTLQYLQCNQLQTFFLLIPADEKFFSKLWKQNMKVKMKKHQKMFQHQRFAMQIQNSYIANELG